MAVIVTITKHPETYADLANDVFQCVLKFTGQTARVDLAADQYLNHSIKNLEHLCRASEGSNLMKITSGAQKCPRQWRRYLMDSTNKKDLLRYSFSQR